MIEYLLGALPAVLLAISLLLGCYPGEEIIGTLARRSRRRRSPAALPTPWHRHRALGTRQALQLHAASRPLRGPPVLSLVQP